MIGVDAMNLPDLKKAMQRERMYLEAKQKNPGMEITPCGLRKSLWESFEIFGDKLAFWFNVGKDTKTIMADEEDDE